MADNITILDSVAASITMATTDTAGVHTPKHSVTSSALPTGAATAAKQPALGTAGSASSDVITVQGITSMTALKTDGSAVTQPVSGTFWQATQPVSLTSTTITGTVAVTKSGTWDITNAGTFATQSVCTNAGTFAVQAAQSGTWTVQPGNTANTTPWLVSLASAMKGTAGTAASEVLTIQGITSMTPIKTDGSGVTQPVSGTVTANLAAGTNGIGKLTANTGVTIGAVEIASAQTLATVTTVGAVTAITNALPAGTNAIGKLAANSGVDIGDVDVTSISAGSNVIGDVGLSGRTTGGLTLHSRIATGTDATNVKASAGQLFWAMVTNTNASARYIKFFNSASAPTLGSGTPVLRVLIPPNSSGYQLRCEQGLAFSTGIGYTLSTTAPDSGAVAVAADEVIVNLGYR